LPDNTPNNLYPTGDGQFIHITAGNQATFIRLAACMGMPELVEDARYAAPTDRSTHEDELDAAIGDWTAEHSLAELEQLLEAGEVPAARIYTMKDIFDDVHYQSRDMLLQLPDDTLGSVTVTGVVPKLSHTPGTVNWAGREVGVNTREVLKRVAGYREEEVETLVESRAVYAGE
jgi:crotonobetainyl-CoA:carnitine CoA-transferase CaiB-like acyl-CoA transferase